MSVYIHHEDTHNLSAPQKIVPIICSLINPRSVIDIGCGTGTFLKVFKDSGIKEVLGIDGEWVNKDLLYANVQSGEFMPANLCNYVKLPKKYDLAICIEVAEHINEEFADNLLRTLVDASDVILFSAAIPYQSGQNHVNEQWPSYWQQKFAQYDFTMIDILRPILWNMEMSEFWYKQNLFFIVKKEVLMNYKSLESGKNFGNADIVHQNLYVRNSLLLNSIQSGKKDLGFYLKKLGKACLMKLGLK